MTSVLLLLVFAQLPDAPGKAETAKLCSECHEIERAISLRQNSAGWQETVNKMTSLGMTGTDSETKAVLDYLTKNFPADEIPKLNVNTATPIELESALSLRRSQAAAVIEYREKHGKFKSMDDLKKVPGLDAAKLDTKKDRVTF
jgi:competence protein ComEA